MQGHLKINIDLFSALCPPQLHKMGLFLHFCPVIFIKSKCRSQYFMNPHMVCSTRMPYLISCAYCHPPPPCPRGMSARCYLISCLTPHSFEFPATCPSNRVQPTPSPPHTSVRRTSGACEMHLALNIFKK
jgi:hypothetical protein